MPPGPTWDTGRVTNLGAQPEILVVGEALIDVVVHLDGHRTEQPGGSPANVALTVGRLGGQPRLLTWLGADARGRRIADWLAGSGVRVDPGSYGTGPTSAAVARLDAHGAARYELDIRWDPLPPEPGPVGLLHIGSVAALTEPGSALVRRLAAGPGGARPGPLVSYDPNIRPGQLPDPSQARREVLALARAADIIKVSDEDLAWIAAGHDEQQVVAGWLAHGTGLVLVTHGPGGATALTAAGATDVPAPAVPVVDTVGAGDTLMGAFLAALAGAVRTAAVRTSADPAAVRRAFRALTLTDVRAMLAYGVAAAAVTVSRAGADPPWPDELREMPQRTAR
jgi:fructokinase